MVHCAGSGLALLLLVASSGDMQAQGLGKLRDAVKDRITAPATSTQSAVAPADGGANGLTRAGLSADRLDRLAAGLRVEAERRTELVATLAELQPRDDVEQCTTAFLSSPAGLRPATEFADAGVAYYQDGQDAKALQAIEEAERAYKTRCGARAGPAGRCKEARGRTAG